MVRRGPCGRAPAVVRVPREAGGLRVRARARGRAVPTAAAIGIPVDTADSRLRAARKRFRSAARRIEEENTSTFATEATQCGT